MSLLKKMPNEKWQRFVRYSMWFVVIGLAATLGYFKKYGEPATALPLPSILIAGLVLAVVLGFTIEHYHKYYQRCPDCRTKMREVHENFHARAKDYHILYCDRCDILWDTTIPKSTG